MAKACPTRSAVPLPSGCLFGARGGRWPTHSARNFDIITTRTCDGSRDESLSFLLSPSIV